MTLAFVVLGLLCLANAMYRRWRKWPAPDQWVSEYGEIPPR